jgi:hypothetical protein
MRGVLLVLLLWSCLAAGKSLFVFNCKLDQYKKEACNILQVDISTGNATSIYYFVPRASGAGSEYFVQSSAINRDTLAFHYGCNGEVYLFQRVGSDSDLHLYDTRRLSDAITLYTNGTQVSGITPSSPLCIQPLMENPDSTHFVGILGTGRNRSTPLGGLWQHSIYGPSTEDVYSQVSSKLQWSDLRILHPPQSVGAFNKADKQFYFQAIPADAPETQTQLVSQAVPQRMFDTTLVATSATMQTSTYLRMFYSAGSQQLYAVLWDDNQPVYSIDPKTGQGDLAFAFPSDAGRFVSSALDNETNIVYVLRQDARNGAIHIFALQLGPAVKLISRVKTALNAADLAPQSKKPWLEMQVAWPKSR